MDRYSGISLNGIRKIHKHKLEFYCGNCNVSFKTDKFMVTDEGYAKTCCNLCGREINLAYREKLPNNISEIIDKKFNGIKVIIKPYCLKHHAEISHKMLQSKRYKCILQKTDNGYCPYFKKIVDTD